MKRRRTSAAVAVAMDHGSTGMLAKARAAHARAIAADVAKARDDALSTARTGPDYGADGEAMERRPSQVGETIAAGVTYRQTLDNHLIDGLARVNQITDRQYKAAQKVLEMATAAGVHLGTTAGWSGGGRQEMSDAMAEAHAAWSRMMIWVGSQNADLLTDMVHGKHPGTWRLATLQSALDKLAHRWKMEG